jgi:phage terminase large subunit-like protein
MGGESREPMRAILLASQGEPLTKSERAHWTRLTGRDQETDDRAEELHVIAGRRSGKSSGIAALAVYLGALCDYSDRLSPGERGVVLIIAENQKQATVLLNYIAGAFEASSVLKQLVENRTKTTLSLNNGIDVEVRAADFRGLRGLTLIVGIIDEIAFLRDDSGNSSNPDTEIVDAIRPGLVTVRGQLITIGSWAQAFEALKRDATVELPK